MQNDNHINQAVETIKTAILKSQYRAAKNVNSEVLSLNYGIGQYVSKNSRQGFWGTGAIETISERLHKELPGLRGFSAANLKFMRQFYEVWNEDFKSLTAVSEIKNNKSLTTVSEIDTQQLLTEQKSNGEKFNIETFLSLGFTHHLIIIRKTNTLAERLFYIRQAVKNKWSKKFLSNQIDENLFARKGELPNNFIKTMPNAQQAFKAIQMFKDEYLLDFLNVEEIGIRDKSDIDERVIEQEIIHNVKNFIMTFGNDFTFVGNQYHLEIFGEEQFPDLLFFNRELNALVVVELKKGDFKTSYLGQLCAYLRIIDDKVKKAHENPTIGLILCQNMNKEFAEYVIQDYNKPMGIATYKTIEDMPEKLRNTLPDIEKLKNLIKHK
ncbi:MAG: DUF1016 family protein [Neisseriaceae bacterium]|nr:DUF1016 family protein [Neisseriaceae bacterium]